MLSPLDLSLLLLYVVIVMGIGYACSRKQTPDDFLIHGRTITTFPLIATITASWVGGGAIVAYGAYVYEFGVAAISVYVGFFLAMFVFARFAPKIRRKAHTLEHLTLGDYFAEEVGEYAGHVATAVAGIGYLFFLVNQFIAGSTILIALTNWSYEFSLLASSLVVLLYLLMGGMRSVVQTDVFQYIVMMLLFSAFGAAAVQRTGVDPALLNPSAMPPSLLFAFLLYGLFTPFSSVEIWQRIYAAKDDHAVRWGLIGSGICVLLLGAAITLLGLSAKTAFPAIHPNDAVAYGMAHLLPKGLLGAGLVMLFAAIMATIDTIVFYLSSSVAKDIARPFLGLHRKEDLMRATRISVILIMGLGVALAFLFRDIIAVILTVAGIMSGVVPPVLGSFYWRLKESAVIASLLSGCIYIGILLLTGNISPELAVGSLFVSAGVLGLWQRFGK